MMIGAKDKLDQRLVELYQRVQTINMEDVKPVNNDDMWRNMSLLAHTNKIYFQIQYKKGCATAVNS